jgi:hypothetical protein
MDVFPVGRLLFFQNSKEPLQNQQQQQTPVYSHSLPSPIVNSARELDRVLSRLNRDVKVEQHMEKSIEFDRASQQQLFLCAL